MQFLQLLISVGSFACPVATALRIEVPIDVLRRQDCANPCGFAGWLCCPSGWDCVTDAANQADCVYPSDLPTPPQPATTVPLPTPPRPATAVPDTSSTRTSVPSDTSTRARSSTSSLRISDRAPVAPQSPFPIPSGDQSLTSSTATETQSSTSTPSLPSPGNGLSSGAVAGAALGAIFGVGLIALGLFLFYKRRARALNAEQIMRCGADLPVACSIGQEARGASELPVVDKTARVVGRGFCDSTLPIAELYGRKAG